MRNAKQGNDLNKTLIIGTLSIEEKLAIVWQCMFGRLENYLWLGLFVAPKWLRQAYFVY